MGAVLLAGFCVTGCHPANLLDEEVEARTSFGFVMWRGHMAKKQTRQQRQELDDAIQELSFGVMTYTNATGSDPIDGAVRAEINGSTLRGLLLKGYEAKRLRIGREKAHSHMMWKRPQEYGHTLRSQIRRYTSRRLARGKLTA